VSRAAASASRELQTARALAHPLRLLLATEYALAVTSPSKIARTLEMPLNLVSYHTRVLADAGLLELVRVQPRRGAREHYYRTTGPTEIQDDDWVRLPLRARRSITRRTLEMIWAEATESLPQGGMDDRRSHVSRWLLRLDGQGRTELATLLHQTAEAAAAIERASRARSHGGGEPAELVILQFAPASAAEA
jgi:DNA-binding transcriptional ArsR family regulator